jgi:hypothetical protein
MLPTRRPSFDFAEALIRMKAGEDRQTVLEG